MSKFKMFGPRVLLEKFKPEGTGKIVLPDTAGATDTHLLGKVISTGDGKLRDGKSTEMFVKDGDVVMFQTSDVISYTQTYRNADNKMLVHMLQGDLIARINGTVINIENLEILGEFLLIRWELRHTDSPIILPENVGARTPDMFAFYVEQKGGAVDLEVNVGDEVILNNGRLNVILITGDNGVNKEYGYILKDFVCGVIPKE